MEGLDSDSNIKMVCIVSETGSCLNALLCWLISQRSYKAGVLGIDVLVRKD